MALINWRRSVKRSPFRFLDLLPELRNIIYSFVFGDVEDKVAFPLTRKRKTIREEFKYKLTPHRKRTPALSLLSVNKQIRAEAFKYVHSVCHGEFYSPREEFSWENIRANFGEIVHSRIAKEMYKAMEVFGPCLQHITQLDVRGDWVLELLCLRPNDPSVVKKLDP